MDPVVFEDRFGKGRVAGFAQHLQRALHRAEVILRQRPRIRSRVRQHLVPLVKRLGQAERVLRAETKTRVRIALQTRQIIKQWRHRSCRLALLGDDAGFAQAFLPECLRPANLPDALGLELVVAILRVRPGKFFIEPAAGVLPRRRVERADDLPVIARHKLADLRLALDHDGQRRRLDPADGRFEKAAELGVERRHRPRAIDADQPVGFRPAVGGVGQRQHVLVCAQLCETFADGRRRHGLQPQPFDGLLRLGILDNVAENQFAFAPGVAGIDQRVHVGAFDQFFEDPEPRLALLDRQQIKMRRDDRQMLERPFAARGLDAFRRHDGEQMADRRRNDILVAFVEVFHFLESAERLGDVAGDGRFLRDDESFAHLLPRACTPGAANMRRKSFLSNPTCKWNFEKPGCGGTKRRKFFNHGPVLRSRNCEGWMDADKHRLKPRTTRNTRTKNRDEPGPINNCCSRKDYSPFRVFCEFRGLYSPINQLRHRRFWWGKRSRGPARQQPRPTSISEDQDGSVLCRFSTSSNFHAWRRVGRPPPFCIRSTALCRDATTPA